MSQPSQHQDMVLSYLKVRLAIGVLTGILPLLMLLIHWIYQTDMQESVSAFYYVPEARNWFVATLFCVSIFLLCYQGYPDKPQVFALRHFSETTLHRIMGFAAFGVGMLPTKCSSQAKTICPHPFTDADKITADLHLICAFILFTCMGLIALFYFPEFQSRTAFLDTNTKKRNATIYRICGGVIVFVGGFWAILKLLEVHSVDLFWVEFVCILAFSIAWIIKSHPKSAFMPVQSQIKDNF